MNFGPILKVKLLQSSQKWDPGCTFDICLQSATDEQYFKLFCHYVGNAMHSWWMVVIIFKFTDILRLTQKVRLLWKCLKMGRAWIWHRCKLLAPVVYGPVPTNARVDSTQQDSGTNVTPAGSFPNATCPSLPAEWEFPLCLPLLRKSWLVSFNLRRNQFTSTSSGLIWGWTHTQILV